MIDFRIRQATEKDRAFLAWLILTAGGVTGRVHFVFKYVDKEALSEFKVAVTAVKRVSISLPRQRRWGAAT